MPSPETVNLARVAQPQMQLRRGCASVLGSAQVCRWLALPWVTALWDTELVRGMPLTLMQARLTLAAADTLPHLHAKIAGCTSTHTAAYDSTQHIAGETLTSLLTNSSASIDLAAATAMHVTFNERIARPYPPADSSSMACPSIALAHPARAAAVVAAVQVAVVARARLQARLRPHPAAPRHPPRRDRMAATQTTRHTQFQARRQAARMSRRMATSLILPASMAGCYAVITSRSVKSGLSSAEVEFTALRAVTTASPSASSSSTVWRKLAAALPRDGA